jgi:hypothetical protein
VPTEHRGDISRSLASVIAKVEKTEPERHEAADRVGVVAPFIAPLLVGGVRRGPVDFHAHSELLVEIVEVPVTRALPDPRLPAGRGQPVRALHPVDVACWAPRRWDRDGDDRTWLIDQAVPLGCCLVAQYRAKTSSEQSGPEQSLPRWIPREGRVHASLEPLPAATAHSVAHRVRIDADHGALSTGNGVCLTGKSLFREHGAHAADDSGPKSQENVACG